MQSSEITQHAHALYRAYGDKAEAEAARKAREAGAKSEAEDWRKIRRHIKELRGPRLT